MKADRFRTQLSLLGVAVGIFSIVAALTLVDAMQRSIREGFAVYGSNILFVDRMPLEPDLDEAGHFRWWNYALRPEVSWREYRYLEQNGDGAFLAMRHFEIDRGTCRIVKTGYKALMISGAVPDKQVVVEIDFDTKRVVRNVFVSEGFFP